MHSQYQARERLHEPQHRVMSSQAYYRLTLGVAACQLALDWADGAFARKLGQVSRLGAWLDVTADLLCRGWLWSAALHGPLSFLPALWETLVFACTHAHSEASSQWKDALAKAPTLPWWARRVMAKGFRVRQAQGAWTCDGALTALTMAFLALLIHSTKPRFLIAESLGRLRHGRPLPVARLCLLPRIPARHPPGILVVRGTCAGWPGARPCRGGLGCAAPPQCAAGDGRRRCGG